MFARPAWVGALYLAALSLRAGLASAGQGDDLGHHADAILRFVTVRFGGEVARVGLALLGTAIVLGAFLGVVSGLVVRLFDVALGRPRRSLPSLALVSFPVVVLFHGACLAGAMARAPQLYSQDFYGRGGLRRTAQVLATDTLGPIIRGPAASPTLPPPRPAEGQGPVNVVLLAADSLRADRLTPERMPTVTAFAGRGTVFTSAYVSLPRTFPSWVTLLTGRHPHTHGITSMFPRWEDRAKDFDALPARLRQAGYSTLVVSDYAGDIFRRIDLGFDDANVPSFDFRQLVRQRAVESQTPLLPFLHSRWGRRLFPVLRELNEGADPTLLQGDVVDALHRARGQGKPFFLTVFFSTAHFPYAAPAPYYGLFTDPRYRGRFKYHKPVGLAGDGAGDTVVDAADIAQIRGLYDGAVRSIDDTVGHILRALDDEGLAARTVVVVTADHGETLYEGGHPPGHGDHLFGDEGTHVPLVVVDPRRPGGQRVPVIARDVDLAPTLYELTGVKPPPDLEGRSLVGAMAGGALPPVRAFAETELWFTEDIPGLPSRLRLPYPSIEGLTEVDAAHGDELVLRADKAALTTMARHRMVRDERWKLVYVPTREGPLYLLFDTATDPLEVTDVAGQHPDVVARLRGDLWGYLLKDPTMMERGGLLLPRPTGQGREGRDPRALRVEEASEGAGAP